MTVHGPGCRLGFRCVFSGLVQSCGHTLKQALCQILCVVAFALAAGCAPTAPDLLLVPGNKEPPPGVDLSGLWDLRDPDDDPLWFYTQEGFIGPASAQQVMRITQEMRQRAAAGGRSPSRGRGGNQRDRAALAQVFLETGTRVKMTQTSEGLFISYDRSVVEEYLFGEHRLAEVGPVAAERASGWAGDTYVVETLDEDRVLMRERWYLTDDRNVLKRDVEFLEKTEIIYTVTQVFDRRTP